MLSKPLCTGLILLSIGLLSGCGGSDVPADRPATHEVTGIVKFKGEPIEGANVTFKPDGGERGASGITDASGKYTLTTFSAGDGAIAGKYKVIVSKVEIQGGDPSYYDENSPNYGKEIPPEAEEKTVYVIPEKYGKVESSGLTATVSEGSNDIPFDLTE